METEEVLFYDPVLVALKLKEVDDISTMLSAWKNEFLLGWNLEIWNRLNKHQKPSSINKVLGFSRRVLQWFWPGLALSIIAYFSIWSALFLSVILLPIQVIMIVYLFLKLYLLVCIASAFNLENPPDQDNGN